MLRSPHTIGTVPPPPVGTATGVKRAPFVGLFLLLILLPMAAIGQPTPVQSLIEQGQKAGADVSLLRSVASRAEKSGLDPQQTAELLRPAVTLAERDLPSTPLLNKTLEGLAKRVPPGRMQPVLQNIQSHTEQAGALVSTWLQQDDVKQLLGESSPSSTERNELITNLTEAQQQEIPLQSVRSFLETLPGAVERRPVSVPEVSAAVSVLPDLEGGNTTPEATHQLLTAALNAGYDAESVRQLPAALESAHHETQRPMDALARGTAQAIARGTPATRVLTNLFQGSVPGPLGPGLGNGPPGTPPGQGKPPGRGGQPPGTGPPGDPPGGPPDDDPGGGPPGNEGG